MLILLLVSLVGSLVMPLVARFMGKGAGLVIALFPIGLLAAFVATADVVERGWVRGEGIGWATAMGLDLTVRLDGFSFLFCLLVTGIGSLVTIYAGGYLTEKSRADRARFFTLILLFMTAMLGTVLADNLLVLAIFWEATTILSFLLVGFDHRSARSRRAALMALQVTSAGGLALLAAVLMIGSALGTYSMGDAVARAGEIAAHPFGPAIIILVMLAAFTKSAQFPFHFWLPNAMQAPTPASAFLHSATMVKLGIYLLARFEPVIAGVAWGRSTLVVVASITMLVAALQALRAEGFKAALAWSTVASLGILTMLVGLDGPRATVAMIGFLFSHALYKAALFFCAGSVLHATGLQALGRLGGLFRFLPLTAAACIGASLSMAGIPPFLGFISKEFLFEAQLASSWELVPLSIAVLVNAVMVGVAGVITLRPFFLGRGKVTEVRHGESFSLVAPPLLLALMGLTISLSPDWITRVALKPAVAAVYGRAIPVDLSVWHGITPMLMLSVVVVSVGALIARFWKTIHQRLRGIDRIDRHAVEHAWDSGQLRLTALGMGVARRLQNGSLQSYIRTATVACGVILLVAITASGAGLRVPAFDDLRLPAAAVALIGVGGAVAAARAHTLVGAMVAVGLAGFSAAIGFLLNGAPDLALTQFTVEALIVVLLTALLLALPVLAPPTRTPSRARTDALVAGGFALLVFVAALDMAASAPARAASDYYAASSYLLAQGHNVVNVILVDFRGFDTFGESTVIAAAALMGASLLSRRTDRAAAPARPVETHFILGAVAWPFFWLLMAASVVILLRGHDQPGGGFVGGLVAALAFALPTLASGHAAAERALRLQPTAIAGAGLLLAAGSGLLPLMAGDEYMTHIWWYPEAFGLSTKLSTTLVFDLGVYLIVLGAVLTYLFGLQREGAK